jgi:acetylornithine deacetylase
MTPDMPLPTLHEATCLDFLSRMIQHKSYSETPGERVLAEFMVDEMRKIGLAAELTPVPGNRVNAVGRLVGSGGGKSLLFNGHVDTNPVT